MAKNYNTAKSRPLSQVRNSTPAVDRYFSVKPLPKNPRVKDSRPTQKIIMKQMEQNIDYKLKLISCGIEIQKNQWLRKIQRVFGDKNSTKGSRIIVKNLDKMHVSGRDILAVSINDFDKKPRYALSSSPLKSYSEKILNVNALRTNEFSQPRPRRLYDTLSKSSLHN